MEGTEAATDMSGSWCKPNDLKNGLSFPGSTHWPLPALRPLGAPPTASQAFAPGVASEAETWSNRLDCQRRLRPAKLFHLTYR